MKNEITVDKAISRGHLIVNVPVLITIVGIPALGFYLSNLNLIPKWGISVSFFLGFSLAWLIWSFMITKWRIWAFSNVRNVHELKKKAIQEKLIWNDGSKFEKTEIKTSKDKKLLKEIAKKFEEKDIYKEDKSLPTTTEIKLSKTKNTIELIVSILILIGGLYMIFEQTKKGYIIGTIFIIIAIYSFIKDLRKYFNNTVQLKINNNNNNNGIETFENLFYSWTIITNEEVIQTGYGKTLESFLIFYHYDNLKEIPIKELNTTDRELENIIRTYRIRHDKSN